MGAEIEIWTRPATEERKQRRHAVARLEEERRRKRKAKPKPSLVPGAERRHHELRPEFRLRADQISDLRALFCGAESAAGVRSSYGGILAGEPETFSTFGDRMAVALAAWATREGIATKQARAAFADRARISRGQLAEYLTDDHAPLITTTHRLAEILGINADWLGLGIGDMGDARRPDSTFAAARPVMPKLPPVEITDYRTKRLRLGDGRIVKAFWGVDVRRAPTAPYEHLAERNGPDCKGSHGGVKRRSGGLGASEMTAADLVSFLAPHAPAERLALSGKVRAMHRVRETSRARRVLLAMEARAFWFVIAEEEVRFDGRLLVTALRRMYGPKPGGDTWPQLGEWDRLASLTEPVEDAREEASRIATREAGHLVELTVMETLRARLLSVVIPSDATRSKAERKRLQADRATKRSEFSGSVKLAAQRLLAAASEAYVECLRDER